MMSKKKVYTQISLDTLKCGVNWEDLQDDEGPEGLDITTIARIRTELPNAPRASRIEQMVDKIPEGGPFRIKISNVLFSCDEEQVAKFFNPIVPAKVALRPNANSNQPNKHRGFGFVDFDTREDLIQALQYNSKPLSGRLVSIEIAEADAGHFSNDNRDNKRYNKGGSFGGTEQSMADSETNWRRRQPMQRENQSSFHSDRPDFRSDNQRGGGQGFMRRGPGDSFRSQPMEAGEHFAEGRDNWRRKPAPPQEHSEPNLENNRGFMNRGPRNDPVHQDASGRFAGPPARPAFNNAPPGFDAPKERVPVKLEPRSIDRAPDTEPARRSASIFGSAKPVNTAAKDMEIEEKLLHEREELKQKLEIQKELSKHGSHEEEEELRHDVTSPTSQPPRQILSRQQHSSTSSVGDGATGPVPLAKGNAIDNGPTNGKIPSAGSATNAGPRVAPSVVPSSQGASEVSRVREDDPTRRHPVTNAPTIQTPTSAQIRTAPASTTNPWKTLPASTAQPTKPSVPVSAVSVPQSIAAPAVRSLPPHGQAPHAVVEPAIQPPQNVDRNPTPTVKPVEPIQPAPQPSAGLLRPHISYSDMAKKNSLAATTPSQPAPIPVPSASESLTTKHEGSIGSIRGTQSESNGVKPENIIDSGSRKAPMASNNSTRQDEYAQSHPQYNHKSDARGGSQSEGAHYGGGQMRGRGGPRRGAANDYQHGGDEESGQGSYQRGGYRNSGADRLNRTGRGGGRSNYGRQQTGNDDRQQSADSYSGRHPGGPRRGSSRGGRGDYRGSGVHSTASSTAQAE